MRIKCIHVVRDVIIVTVLFAIGGFIAGSARQGLPTPVAMLVATLLMGTVGFCLCGCLTIIVALGVWLTNSLLPLLLKPFNVLAWAISILCTSAMMLVGGALSSMLARVPKEKECQVDEAEKGVNG